MNIPEVSLFPIGGANEAFAQYFIGQSYLNMLSTEQVIIGNVTFKPKAATTGISIMRIRTAVKCACYRRRRLVSGMG